MDAKHTLNGIPSSGVGRLGIARVTKPTNIGREEYVAKSIRSCSCAIKDPFRGDILAIDASIPINLISYIKFPDDDRDNGSLVSYKVVDKRLIFVIDGVLVESSSGSPIAAEGEHIINGNESSLLLGTKAAVLNVNGDVEIKAIDKESILKLISGKIIQISAKVDSDNSIAEIKFDPSSGWSILRDRSTSNSEPAVLGDTTVEKLESIIDQIQSIADAAAQITVPSPFGPLGVPLNAAQFIAASQQLTLIKNSLEQIKSKNLTID